MNAASAATTAATRPAIAYPAPQHMNPSRRSDAAYVDLHGKPLRPFTALTLPGHEH